MKDYMDLLKERYDDVFSLQNTSNTFQKFNRTIVYLHIGKSGGTTLDKVLYSNCMFYMNRQNRNNCVKQFSKKNETRLSKLTKHTFHTRPPKKKIKLEIKNNVTSFLFTLRNPISRVISSYNHDHSDNSKETDNYIKKMRSIFYHDCFPTIEDLANVLSKKQKNETFLHEDNVTIDCFAIGKQTLQGFGHVLYNTHLAKNYAWYTKFTTKIYPQKEVLALRTDHLWDDIIHLNSLLGGNNDLFYGIIGHKFTHGSESRLFSSTLSPKGKEVICCNIRSEIQTYQILLQKASNLNAMDKKSALDELYDDCGILESMRNESFSWMKWRNDYC